MTDSRSLAGQVVAFAADHAGVALKDALAEHLREAGAEVIDLDRKSVV